jgi:hypothetical protein
VKLVAKIFVAVAFSFLLAHDFVAHHHHDEFEIAQQHYDEDADHHDHSIFSFGDLDDNYLSSQTHFSAAKTIIPLWFLLSENFSSNNIQEFSNEDFAFAAEYPPPEKFFPSFSHRGPPTFCLQ